MAPSRKEALQDARNGITFANKGHFKQNALNYSRLAEITSDKKFICQTDSFD